MHELMWKDLHRVALSKNNNNHRSEQCTFSPSYPRVPHPWIQPTADGKYLGKKFQKVPKAKLELLCSGNYLHSIYVELDIIHNLEMI